MNKREKVFSLFDAGYSPSSPEVKALKIKAQTRANYFWEWKKEHGEATGSIVHGGDGVGRKSPGSETIGGIDETRTKQKNDLEEKPKPPETLSQEEQEEAKGESREAVTEESKIKEEAIGAISEAVVPKGKDGKLATTIDDDGIKCTIFLSLQTLALFRIAKTTQAQLDGGEDLTLGDFLDTCAEDFFGVRGKKLGLISSGGK